MFCWAIHPNLPWLNILLCQILSRVNSNQSVWLMTQDLFHSSYLLRLLFLLFIFVFSLPQIHLTIDTAILLDLSWSFHHSHRQQYYALKRLIWRVSCNKQILQETFAQFIWLISLLLKFVLDIHNAQEIWWDCESRCQCILWSKNSLWLNQVLLKP